MSVAARLNLGSVSTVHIKRLRLAHDSVINRLRSSKEVSGLVQLFDKHFNDGSTQEADSIPVDPKVNAHKQWRKLKIVLKAKFEFNRRAKEKFLKKNSCQLFVYYFEKFGLMMADLRDDSWFTTSILLCIIVAGVLVGIQTYDGMEEKPILQLLDFIILTVFCVEVVVKLLAESTRPWLYFTGPDYKWNWFDFLIVVFSLPIPGLSGMNASFLRLLRLARITKIFKKIRELQVIVSGLIHGLKSIVWILLLMMLIFYLFAVAAVIVFKPNDPFHFGNIPISMVSLFRAATLEDWSDFMYINYFGCDDYGDYEDVQGHSENVTKVRIQILPSLHYHEVFFDQKCTHSISSPVLSVLFFVSFLVVASFVMLSLFIGAVTMGMSESMEVQENEIKAEKHIFAQLNSKDNEKDIKEMLSKVWSKLDDQIEAALVAAKSGNRLKNASRNLALSLSYKSKITDAEVFDTDLRLRGRNSLDMMRPSCQDQFLQQYQILANKCAVIEETSLFKNGITFAILVASVLVGLSTEEKFSRLMILQILEEVILAIFIIECMVKVVARGVKPWTYFDDSWNTFDFVIVVASIVPKLLTVGAFASIVAVFRLLRLLRVFKLAKQFKQLRIIVEALISGFSSMTYISLILVIFFYVYAIVGMLLFQSNDPLHFGYLHVAILTLFRCITMEDWTDVMYINILGCKLYGYDDFENKCQHSKGLGYTSVFYFISFIVLGSLILLSLFIGVVSTAMSESEQAYKNEELLNRQIEEIKKTSKNMDDDTIHQMHEFFLKLDIDQEGTLSYGELETLFKILTDIDSEFNLDQVLTLFDEVDDDDSGVIEFPEFINLLLKVHTRFKNIVTKKNLYLMNDRHQKDAILKMKSMVVASTATGSPNPTLEKPLFKDLEINQKKTIIHEQKKARPSLIKSVKKLQHLQVLFQKVNSISNNDNDENNNRILKKTDENNKKLDLNSKKLTFSELSLLEHETKVLIKKQQNERIKQQIQETNERISNLFKERDQLLHDNNMTSVDLINIIQSVQSVQSDNSQKITTNQKQEIQTQDMNLLNTNQIGDTKPKT